MPIDFDNSSSPSILLYEKGADDILSTQSFPTPQSDSTHNTHSPDSQRNSTPLTHLDYSTNRTSSDTSSPTLPAAPDAEYHTHNAEPRLLPAPPSQPFQRVENNDGAGFISQQWKCRFNTTTCRQTFDDAASRTRHEDNAHRHRCRRGCDNVGFRSKRDLEARHYLTAHASPDAASQSFVCGGCGKKKPGFRSDNHFRHLKICSAREGRLYQCGRCGHQTLAKQEHLDHWETECRKKKMPKRR